MKRQIIATLLASATAFCAFGSAACGGKTAAPDGNKIGQVTKTEWINLFENLKGLGGLKNYTLNLTRKANGEIIFQTTRLIDFENMRVYVPDSFLTDEGSFYLVYCGIEKKYVVPNGSIAFDFIDLYEATGYGFIPKKYTALDRDRVCNLFTLRAGLTVFLNIGYDGEIIGFENAYDIFTYDVINKIYTAKDVEIILGGNYSDGIFNYFYQSADIDIAFYSDSFKMTAYYRETNDCRMEIEMANFDDSEINLPDGVIRTLNG